VTHINGTVGKVVENSKCGIYGPHLQNWTSTWHSSVNPSVSRLNANILTKINFLQNSSTAFYQSC